MLTFLALFCGFSLAVTCFVTAAAPRRVAINDFSTDDNDWASITAAADFAPLVQVGLQKAPGIEWVERAQLGLVQKELELTSVLGGQKMADIVQRARWNRADWLITGHFASKEGVRELLLEVIDLRHADVLAERRVKVPTPATAPLRSALTHADSIVVEIRALLQAAAQRERAVTGQPIVAVLFYPDSDVFQSELLATLDDPKLPGGPIRTLRIPRARESLDESELALGGFTTDPKGGWQGIADVYVWGSLVRFESGSVDGVVIRDAKSPETALTVWDGRLSPSRFVEESKPVARREFDEEVKAQARRLGASLADFVRTRRAGTRDDDQRTRVSQALVNAAEKSEGGKSHQEAYLHEPDGRRHFFNVVQTLQAACFFDPQNQEAHEKLLRTRWDRKLEHSSRNAFRFFVGRSEAWGRYVDRFGLPDAASTVEAQLAAITSGPPPDPQKFQALIQKAGRTPRSIAQEFLDSSRDVVENARLGNRESVGCPSNIPEADAARWVQDLTLEVARRAVVAAGRPDADCVRALGAVFDSRGPGTFYLRDASRRMEFLEKIWPQIPVARQSRAVAPGKELRDDIQWTFEELGKKEAGEKFLASVPPPPVAKPDAPPPTPDRLPGSRPSVPVPPLMPWEQLDFNTAQLLRVPGFREWPAGVTPVEENFEAIQKAGIFRIHDLAVLAGRVWIIGEGLETAEVTGADRALSEGLRPTKVAAKRLFCFDPATKQLERVDSTRQFTPVSLMAHAGLLWLALGSDGVATLDPANRALRRFGPVDGLDVTSAYRFAAVEGRVFVTANMSSAFVWERDKWQPWNTAFTGLGWGDYYGAELRQFSGSGSRLFLYQKSLGIYETQKPGWKVFTPDQTELGFVNCVAAGSRGFWLGGSQGLHFVDAETGEVVNRLRSIPVTARDQPRSVAGIVEAFAQRRVKLHEQRTRHLAAANPLARTSRLGGSVTALASDGDFLWAAMTNYDYYPRNGVMLLHQPSGRWVGQFSTVGYARSLTVDGDDLWVGLMGDHGDGKKCLVRVKKQTFTSLPESRWMGDSVAAAATRGDGSPKDLRDQAVWQFLNGDYAASSNLLARMDPPTAEGLFLQGLCHDAQGLNQPEKSRAFFDQVASQFPEHPLAREARTQVGLLSPASSR